MNCIPRNVFTPMYINTPYSTGIGICLEGKKVIIEETIDYNVDLLENGSKLCGESDKKEDAGASDSLKKEIKKASMAKI